MRTGSSARSPRSARTSKYEAYFNEDFDPDEDDPDQEVRDTVGAETEYVPDGSGCVASLTGFSCYYQDGIRPSPYPVTLS